MLASKSGAMFQSRTLQQRRASPCLTSRRCQRDAKFVVKATGFEPQAPGAAQLASAGVVLASTIVSGLYWWLVIVPNEKGVLIRMKKEGALKEYLEEINEDESRTSERWFYNKYLKQMNKRNKMTKTATSAAATSAEVNPLAPAEGTDPLGALSSSVSSQGSTPPRRQYTKEEEDAIIADLMKATPRSTAGGLSQPPNPDLLKPAYAVGKSRFWSFDNPVVVFLTVITTLAATDGLTTGKFKALVDSFLGN